MKDVLCAPVMAGNPYQSLLARALEPHGYHLRLEPLSWRIESHLQPRDALLHLHWLAPLFSDPRRARTAVKLALFVRALRRLQARGIPFVWTAHNLYEHEREHIGLERRLRLWLARHAAALIVHGPSAAVLVRREYELSERNEVAVVPHGHYIDTYPARHTRIEARQLLGLDPEAPTLLHLGSVSPYKGVLKLVEAVARVGSGLQLIVAGQPSPPWMEAELRARAQGVAGMRLRLGFLSDEEVAAYGAACDLFVLPHREMADDPWGRDNPRFEILTSGSAVLAMSLGRPCLAPRMGCFSELLGEDGGFLFDPGQPDGLEMALRAALLERSRWNEMGLRNRGSIERVGWDRVAERTASVYARALRRSGVTGDPPPRLHTTAE
jgi:glycosyltransferase involved in cell wall biosynthesis